jgi:FkbM family methyltransferase
METVFLDIGSGDGTRVADWLDKDRKAHAFCFDPRQECFDSATSLAATVKKKAANAIQRMHPVKAAVSSVTGNAQFHVLNDISSCSLLPLTEDTTNIRRWRNPPGKVFFTEVGTVPVQTIRMEKFLADRRIENVTFARIEVQGSALDVLKSFGKKLVSVMEIAVKVHTINYDIYQGQTKKNDLLDFMKENGFSVINSIPWSRNQEEIIWFVNMRFATSKRLAHLDILPSSA